MDLLAFAKNIADRVERQASRFKGPVADCVIDIHGNIVLDGPHALPADSRMRLPGRPRLQIVSVPAFAAAYRWPIRGQLSTLHQAARYSGRRF